MKEVKRSFVTRMFIGAGVGTASFVILVLIHLGRWSGDGPSKQQDVRLCREIKLLWFCQAHEFWKSYIAVPTTSITNELVLFMLKMEINK